MGVRAETVCPGRVSFARLRLLYRFWPWLCFNILCKLVMFLLCHCSRDHVCCLLTKAKSFVHLSSCANIPPFPLPTLHPALPHLPPFRLSVCDLYKIPRPVQLLLLLLSSFLISHLFFLLLFFSPLSHLFFSLSSASSTVFSICFLLLQPVPGS